MVYIKKRILAILFTMLFSMTTYAAEITPQDLIFHPQGGGKFIYCNNTEAIWRYDLSDNSNPNPKYIMNNDELGMGKYSMFISHINHTERYENHKIVEMGFDIEVDVQFIAKQASTIQISAVGYDVQRLLKFSENGLITKTQSSWDLMDAWTDYMQMPIYTTNSNTHYNPRTFQPIEIELKQGEQVWLSQFIDNYKEVPFLKFMHILADFEILTGSADVNIAALKHNGKLRDRSHHSSNAERGAYGRDKQYKGIADTLPAVNADLHYTINDDIKAGTHLPVKVYNQYNLNGNTVTTWHTHINPQEDMWSKNSSAESDMLSFEYYDEEKLKFYNSNIPTEQRNATWIFDVFHSDTKESDIGIPNYKLSTAMDNKGNGCNLGNYGVSTNYHVTVNNTGDKTRYLNYKLKTSATNLVIVKDENGKPMQDYIVRKRSNGQKTEDIMASIKLPPKEITSFTIAVILPPNYPGGMENAFEISDEKHENACYEPQRSEIIEPYPFTGKEYIKWYDGRLYFSNDSESWTEKLLSPKAAEVFKDHWNNYEIKFFDGIYAVRWKEYDAAPYFYHDVPEFCNRVYFFDDSFHLLTTHYYDGYPSDIFYREGKIITTVEGKEYFTTLPTLEKTISVKLDDRYLQFDVNPIIEEGRTLVPIRALFEGMGAQVSWDEDTRTAKVTMKHQTVSFTIDSPIALVDSMFKLMDVPARQYGFRTLVPLRFISEALGYQVSWDDLTKTVTIEQ